MIRKLPIMALLIGALAVTGQAEAGGGHGWQGPAVFGAIVGSAIIGSALINSNEAVHPTTNASHNAWRTSGPISAWLPAPKRWATLGVVASKVPVINRYTGIQMELPRATAARSRELTRPAITASTKPMAVVASCPIMMGKASASRL